MAVVILFQLRCIAFNDLAVYDVLTARIRALRSKVQGRQNVVEKSHTKALCAVCGFS
jgi:hypothetical protein